MFATGSLARRIERAEASLLADCAATAARRGADRPAFMIPIRGGVGAFAEPESPINKVAGRGFDDENVQRSGFAVLYVRAILMLPIRETTTHAGAAE
jgi:hypothetical protein